METVDDTESGNLCYKGRNQHSQEKQSHDELFAAEFKSFDDKCGNGSQHYIKYQGNRQYYYSIFKADQQIFIGKYFFIIFKVRSLPAGGSNGEDSVMAPLDFKEANNVRRIGANTIMTMPIHITCLITC